MDDDTAVLGLDIGGTKLAAGVVDTRGGVHSMVVAPTARDQGKDDVIMRLLALGDRAVAEAGRPVRAVGIASGGPLDAATGVLRQPLHLPGWTDVPIASIVAEHYGVRALVENDATLGMLGEHTFGAARGARTALYLTVSTGVGGGAVVHGRLHAGATGNGGEFGHITVRPGGRPCSCGRSGCLEAYVSGTSIAERAREALGSEPSTLDARPEVRAEHVVEHAAAGDPVAARVWAETVAVLGQAVTDLVNAFEPEVVVLGGGVTRAGAALLDPVARTVAAEAMTPVAQTCRVELAALGDAVCVVGAAARALLSLEEDVRAGT